MLRLFKPPEWNEWTWYQRALYVALIAGLLLGLRWAGAAMYRWLMAH
jgi:hypothetical protein